MRKIILLFVVVVLVSVPMVHGKRLGVLTGVLQPEGLEVSGDRLYVVEGSTFFVYVLKGLNFIAKFGKKGQGPGELMSTPIISNKIRVLQDQDQLFAEGLGKVIFFSKDFKLSKEMRKKGMVFKTMPADKNFVTVHLLTPGKDKKLYLSLSLLDSQMNVIKRLYKQEFPEREKQQNLLIDSINFDVYQGKIFVEESPKGFLIEVFDSSGSRLYEIRKDVKPHKVTEKDKKVLLEAFKQDKLVNALIKSSGGWDNFKKTVKLDYPDAFPVIQDMIVKDDKIYVSTYETEENKEKFIIMDLRGKIIRTTYLPIPRKASFSSRTFGSPNRFYGIVHNKFYYLVENEENEEWEVHAAEIK